MRCMAYSHAALLLALMAAAGCSGSTELPTGPLPDAGFDDAAADGATDALPGDAGGDATGCPYTVSFVTPTDGQQLDQTDDANGDLCVDGFQYEVAVAVSAPDGIGAQLFSDGVLLATTQVAEGIARFENVQLNSQGTSTLAVRIVGQTCEASATVTVQCAGAPTCEITKPVVGPSHPELNGVPVAEGGDRVSAPGSAYQVAFEVTTSVADGQAVLLHVDGSTTALAAPATGGRATFPGVTLEPDGEHTVVATCTAKSGIDGKSAALTYLVDTQAPDLEARRVVKGQVGPLADDDHFNPDDDADPAKDGLQLRVCGATTAEDALDLPDTLGPNQQNFCVAVGTSSPQCAAATSTGIETSASGACVDLDCPGAGPFNLTLTMRDDAGNFVQKTLQGLTCASTLPTVQFADPVGDTAPFADVSKHILAASMPDPQRRDQDPDAPGAQYTVAVCTNAPDSSARLLAGLQGQELVEVATGTVAEDTTGRCAATGLSHLVEFASITLPPSDESTGGELVTPTSLRAEITDVSQGVGTATIDLWVDSVAPVVAPVSPSGLCTQVYQQTEPVVQEVILATTSVPVHMTVTNSVGVQNYTGDVLGAATTSMGQVTFYPGENALAATVTEPSGNTGSMATPCVVTVGFPPAVTWQSPVQGDQLTAAGVTGPGRIPDADPATPGWQGTLRVCTDIDVTAHPDATVQFSNSVNGDMEGPVQLDTSGCASLDADVPAAASVVLTATTSPIDMFSGTASISVPVDDTVPPTVEQLTASVADRRQTTMHLSWTAPNDNGTAVAGYQVRVSPTPITTQAQFEAAQAVAYSGTPSQPGQTDGIDVRNLMIERDYHFAVAPVDAAGNQGPFATTGPHRAAFNTTVLAPTDADTFGYSIDGRASLNGDSFSDLIVGNLAGTRVHIYFGSASGYEATPSVTITGPSPRFGIGVSVVGDIDGDSLADIAIGSPQTESGKVYIYKGRTAWTNTALTEADADYVINTDASFTNSMFGSVIVPVGDFNGDTFPDFAVGSFRYNTDRGRVTVILGGSSFPAQVNLPADAGTRAVIIDGDPNIVSQFGYSIVGISNYYTATTGTTLVVGAPNAANITGRLYAFHGQMGTNGVLSTVNADHAVYGVSQGSATGSMVRALRLSALANPALVIASPRANGATGLAQVRTGAPATGPFTQVLATLSDSTGAANDLFGTLIETGTFSGVSSSVSFIGDSAPDVVLAGTRHAGASARLYLIEGNKAVAAGTADIAAIADVTVQLPADWAGVSLWSRAVRDVNNDGFGDLAVGERVAAGTSGRVLVLW